MPLPQLNKAEQDFFSSQGEKVADSLKPSAIPSAVTESNITPVVMPKADAAKSEDQHDAVQSADVVAAEKTAAEKVIADEAKSSERQRLIKEMGLVPLEALQEARGESKALKEEMRQLRQWQDSMTAQLRQTVTAVPQEAIPDANEDPIAYQSWAIGKLAEQNQKIQEWQQQQVSAQEAHAQVRQAAQWANAKEQEFIKDHPDYPKAWSHVVDVRRRELMALGLKEGPQIDAAIAQDAQVLIAQALTNDRNPAEILWNYAKARGFQESATPSADKKDKTVEILERIEAGQHAVGGLKGGSAPAGKMTPQELASMPVKTAAQRAAFAKAWKEAMG